MSRDLHTGYHFGPFEKLIRKFGLSLFLFNEKLITYELKNIRGYVSLVCKHFPPERHISSNIEWAVSELTIAI